MSVKKRSTHKPSARRARLDADDAPELTGAELMHPKGVWRRGRSPVSVRTGKAAMLGELTGKTRINIHLDNDLISYFKRLAGGRGYQTLINAALRREMEGKDLTAAIAQTIQKELARHMVR